jgi:hypothetical protein
MTSFAMRHGEARPEKNQNKKTTAFRAPGLIGRSVTVLSTRRPRAKLQLQQHLTPPATNSAALAFQVFDALGEQGGFFGREPGPPCKMF